MEASTGGGIAEGQVSAAVLELQRCSWIIRLLSALRFNVADIPQPVKDIFRVVPTLKQKDLCLIPWRVVRALQADGWYLRSDIVWAKPNPMPESVTDRPTKAHEYVFLLTKSPR